MRFVSPQDPGAGAFNAQAYGAKGDGSVDDAPAIQKAIDAAYASLLGSTPTFVAAGTASSGTTTATPGVPAGYAAGDVFLMFVESNYNEPVATPSGWAVIDGFPKANGSAVTGATQLSGFWKRATSSESAPTVADPGDHIIARIFGFRGCRAYGVPWDGVAISANDIAGTSGSFPTTTTNSINTLVVNVAAAGTDIGTAQFSAWANSDLTSVTERGDDFTTSGAGGGIGLSTGVKASAGAVSATTYTLAGSSAQVMATIALAPAEVGTGATVIIPPGNYRLNSQLNVKSLSTIIANGAYLWSGNNNYLLVSNYSGAWGYNGGHDIQVYGGIWDGKAQGVAADVTYNVMGFYHCTNVSVRDVTIRNVAGWHGFEFNATDNGLIDGARFEGFRDTTTAQSRQFSAAMQIDLGSNDSVCSKNITIQNCYVGPSRDGSGLGVFGRGFDSHTDALGKWYTGIKIINNTIEGTIQQAIQTYSWNDSIISGNVIRNAGLAGIRVAGNAANDVKNLTVANNVISSPVESGIEVIDVSSRVVRNSTISGNIIDNPSAATNKPGMYLRFMSGCTISGNTVRGGGNVGISVFDCDNIAVSSNSISGTGDAGVRLNANCSAIAVTNNSLSLTGKQGVYMTGAGITQCLIGSNLAVSCGTTLTGTTGSIEISSTTGNDNSFMGNRIIKGTSLATYAFRAVNSTANQTTVVLGNSAAGWGSTYASVYNANSTGTGTGAPIDDIQSAAQANGTELRA